MLEEVILLEAMENYTMFHLLDGKKIVSSLNLKKHQEKLNDDFIRVNRSMLVNVKFIMNTYCKDHTNYLRLRNGNEIKVSRRRQDTLLSIAS